MEAKDAVRLARNLGAAMLMRQVRLKAVRISEIVRSAPDNERAARELIRKVSELFVDVVKVK